MQNHQPVLLAECLQQLALTPGALAVDCTLGDGGHAEAMLQRNAPDGVLIGLDRDAAALAIARARLARFGRRAQFVHASFADLTGVLRRLGFAPATAGAVLLDLGISSRQLADPSRGFSFKANTAGGLDMRFDARAQNAGGGEDVTAAKLLARASEYALAKIFREYGQLPQARKLARTVVRERHAAPLQTAADLRRVIIRAGVGRGRKHDPATLVFQALRIAVNDELAALDAGLTAAVEALQSGGRLCVLSYHSLEDGRVKRLFMREEKGCTCPPEFPACVCENRPRLRRINKKPLRAGVAELAKNPRARGARLRAARRITTAETRAPRNQKGAA